MENKTTTVPTLNERVEAHWNNCLAVNSSWVEFTNEIGLLNLLYDAGADDLEWLAELFADTEQFEEEDSLELLWAIQEVARDFTANPLYVTSYQLEWLVGSGFDAADVAEVAREAGVRAEEVDEFEDEVGLVPA
jgi:hypothetical protein